MPYKNKKNRKQSNKKYYLNNKQKIKERCRIYYLENKNKRKQVNKLYRLNNKEKIKEKDKLYYFKNKEKINELNRLRYINNKNEIKKYRLKNKDKTKRYNAEYRINNKEKIKEYRLKNKERRKQYLLNNRHLVKALDAKRRATKLRATPKFANLNKIKEIYKNCPKGYHVDHIVPLKSKLVCGLHVEWNLQYLTPSANLSKSNKLII
jgi:hypothetical protein